LILFKDVMAKITKKKQRLIDSNKKIGKDNGFSKKAIEVANYFDTDLASLSGEGLNKAKIDYNKKYYVDYRWDIGGDEEFFDSKEEVEKSIADSILDCDDIFVTKLDGFEEIQYTQQTSVNINLKD